MPTPASILALLKDLIACPSTSASKKEQTVEIYLENFLKKLPYFTQHPTFAGAVPIPGDSYGRSIIFAFVQGTSPKTVLLLNHHDVVSAEDYGNWEPLAYDAEAITALLAKEDSPSGADFASDAWLGGRGSCDMKGGMAAQLAYLEEYSKQPSQGSLLFLSVADEETFSAGMRSALPFLQEFKTKYKLDYVLALNSEPNRQEGSKQIVSVGSVGKLLACVLIQGKSVHLGEYSAGLNPLGVLAELITRTEGSNSWQETVKNEHTIPPVWLNARDQKLCYDVSLAPRAYGLCSFQTFTKGPSHLMSELKKELLTSAQAFSKNQPLATTLKVLTYEELLQEVSTRPNFASWQAKTKEEIKLKLQNQALSFPEATLWYINELVTFTQALNPLAVLAWSPPYYPPTNSHRMAKSYYPKILDALSKVRPLTYEEYFLGVSDCSYLGHTLPHVDTTFAVNAPLWGDAYAFDQAALSSLNIPFLLLGPWGKDLHQRTERVNITSLTLELPRLLQTATEAAWKS